MDALAFRRACSKFTTGITVATVLGPDGAPHGMTVNSFTSVSIEPPMVLICVDQSSVMHDLFGAAGRYGVSVLSESQQDLSSRFAQRGGDRFGSMPWIAGSTGVPLLNGALAHFECEITQLIAAGDHTIVLGRVVHLDAGQGDPLLYFESTYRKISD